MAKVPYQSFENLRGIDARASNLTRDEFYAQNLTNCRFASSKAVRKRNGYEVVGQAGGFVGGHEYVYFDADTGATVTEILAINDNLWKLGESSFVITRTGATTWSTEVVVEGGARVFKLKEGSTTILSQSLGTGLEDLPVTIEELRIVIDALANYSCSTLTKWARIDGNQSSVTTLTIDTNSGDLVVGDKVTFWDYVSSKLVVRTVTAVGATTLTLDTQDAAVTVKDNQYLSKAAAPAASLQMTTPQSTTGTTITLTFNYWDYINFDFLPGINYAREPFKDMWALRNNSSFTPPSFLNNDNICLIAYYDQNTFSGDHESQGRIFKYDGQRVYRAGLPKPTIRENVSGTHGLRLGALASGSTYLIKARYRFLDARGRYTYSQISNQVSITGTGAAKYLAVPFPAFADRGALLPGSPTGFGEAIGGYFTVNGNQVGVTTIAVFQTSDLAVGDQVVFYDSSTSKYVRRTVTGLTFGSAITISGAAVNVSNTQTIYSKVFEGFPYYFDTIDSGSSNTTIDVNDSDFQINDPIIFTHTNVGSIPIPTRKVTAAGSGSITIDSAVSAINTEYASRGMTVEVYITQAGGGVFYKMFEAPVGITPGSGTALEKELIFSTNTLGDYTVLGEPLDEPPLGFEWDLPPKARHLTTFQDLPVATGDNQAPNNIYWPDIENIEGWPLASNVASINSNIQGPVTAIGASGDDELFIFKRNAVYALYGSLATGAIASRKVSEGSWGVSSHNSLLTVDEALIGICDLGITRLANGKVDEAFGYRINPLIRRKAAKPGSTGLVMHQAHAVNDPGNLGCRFYIPYSSYTSGSASNSLGFFLDLDRLDISEPVWLDESFTDSLEPSRGWFSHDNVTYFLSSAAGGSNAAANSGHFFREIRVKDSSYASKNYYDNHLAITQTVRFADLFRGDPSLNQEFLWMAIYSFLTTPDSDFWTTNTLTVNTYRNWQESTVSTTFAAAFSASTTFEATQKLASDKARALRIVITNAVAGESSYISGIGLMVSGSYVLEEFRK